MFLQYIWGHFVKEVFIVNYDTDTPASWRLFLKWLAIVKELFFTWERILLSSTIVVFLNQTSAFLGIV